MERTKQPGTEAAPERPRVHLDVARAPAAARHREGWRAVWHLRRDPLSFFRSASEQYGDVVQLRIGTAKIYLLRHPDDIARVLVDNNRNYDKDTRGYDTLRRFLHNGLLTSEGDFWRRQRRIAQPAFHRQKIARLGDVMLECTLDMLERWESVHASGRTIDMEQEMTALTLRIASRTLLSTEVTGQYATIGPAVAELNRQASQRLVSPLSLPEWLPTPKNHRYRANAAALDRIVYGIIEHRRKTGGVHHDLLAMLMQARDLDTGESMSDEQLRDEVMTMFLAGHETTANALTWTLHLLTQHPDITRRAQAEIDAVLGTRPPTSDDLAQLPLLGNIIKEGLRLYPPAWSFSRRCLEGYVLGGYRIEPQTMVLVSPYVTHRDARFWPNPDAFDPSRFEPRLEKARPKFAYLPFGGGPRQCIGNAFALMEAQIVLAAMLRRFTPVSVAGHRVVPEPLITLRPKFGVPMRLDRAAR